MILHNCIPTCLNCSKCLFRPHKSRSVNLPSNASIFHHFTGFNVIKSALISSDYNLRIIPKPTKGNTITEIRQTNSKLDLYKMKPVFCFSRHLERNHKVTVFICHFKTKQTVCTYFFHLMMITCFFK